MLLPLVLLLAFCIDLNDIFDGVCVIWYNNGGKL